VRHLPALIAGQAVSTAGSLVSSVAFIWLVVRLTGSAASLSIVSAALVVPTIAFTAVGGVLTDRVSPRLLLVSADIGRGLIMLALAALTWHGHVRLGWLVAAAAGLGVGQSLFDPALRATVAMVTGADGVLRANAALQVTNRAVGIVIPALAGVLVVVFGVPRMLAADGVSFLVSAVSVVLARLPRRHPDPDRRTRIWQEMAEGLRYALRVRYVRWLLATAALINLADALVVIYPLFVRNVLHADAFWYGLLNSAVMAGLLVVTLIFLAGGKRVPLRAALIVGAGSQGAGLTATALAGSRPVSVAGFFLFGFGMGSFGTASITMLQRELPRELLGRVLSLYGMSALVLMPVGYALAGSLTSAIGLTTILAIAGAVMLAVAVMLAAGRRRLTAGQ
jgi:MFS family permease